MKTELGEYEGAFVNGAMEGFGNFKWRDGKTYEGGFRNNKIHGKGILMFPNGQRMVGEWNNGENIQIQGLSSLKSKKN